MRFQEASRILRNFVGVALILVYAEERVAGCWTLTGPDAAMILVKPVPEGGLAAAFVGTSKRKEPGFTQCCVGQARSSIYTASL